MKEAKDVVCCVVDNAGSYLALARSLAKEYKTVFYTNPSWIDPYPVMNKAYIGYGFDEIRVVESPFLVYDHIDLWVFPDTYSGPLVEWLRSQGELVFGAGQEQELETDRDLLKEHMQDLKLPVNPWQKIIGLNNLRDYLEENENVFVKINKWRGSCESFFSKSFILSEPFLDELEHRAGPLTSLLEFIVEEPISGDGVIEAGYDGLCVEGQYPSMWLAGVEIKDRAYVGKITPFTSLSPLVTDFLTAMAPTFKNYGCKNFLSTENRIKGQVSTMIDITCRTPCPPGDIYLNIFENLGSIIYAAAQGQLIETKATAHYGVELLLESDWAITHTQPIYFPEKFTDNIHLKKACLIDDTHYVIPQLYGSNDIGAISVVAETLDDAVKKVIEVAESIEGQDIHIRTDALDTAEETFNKFEALNGSSNKKLS